jgi:holo-[acyl-carrier protein] synthase
MDSLNARILGIGTDLAEVDRIEQSIVRFGDRFINRIYTPDEIAYVTLKANRYERYAARFAAKEAGMKALGTGWISGIGFLDFEVANLSSGRPILKLHGRAAEYAAELGARHVHLSLTHTATMAMAVVILEA